MCLKANTSIELEVKRLNVSALTNLDVTCLKANESIELEVACLKVGTSTKLEVALTSFIFH